MDNLKIINRDFVHSNGRPDVWVDQTIFEELGLTLRDGDWVPKKDIDRAEKTARALPNVTVLVGDKCHTLYCGEKEELIFRRRQQTPYADLWRPSLKMDIVRDFEPDARKVG